MNDPLDKLDSRISAATTRRGFTLVEMITVLTIIILVLAIAIPVWNALIGNSGLAAAQNQIAAFIGNARADAVFNRQTTGVIFFIDPKTQQTAMAEVQTQPQWNGTGYSTLYTPVIGPAIPNPNNGQANALELVNSLDPTVLMNPPHRNFYRDIILLPAGVGVALNNNTYTYNQASAGNHLYFSYGAVPTGTTVSLPPLDRYLRLGAIMFAPDGTLTTIPIAIPFYDQFTAATPLPPAAPENLLCERLGMVGYGGTGYSIASNVNVPNGASPTQIPLVSSVGLVIFDHNAYISQHATATPQIPGDGLPFNDLDMNYTLYTLSAPSGAWQPNSSAGAADKAIEEGWIDQNGIALLVSPFNGSLIKAK